MSSSQLASASCPDPDRLWPWFAASVPDHAMLLLDPDGCILSWNRAAELMTRYAAHSVIGRHFSLLYTPDDIASGRPDRELRIAATTGHLTEVNECCRMTARALWRMYKSLRSGGRMTPFVALARSSAT
jgi:PAS domain-containing protein